MKITKTEEERERILAFIQNISKLIYNYGFDHPQKDMTEIFERLKKDLYDNSGTIYLCFACSGLLDREDIKVENFYQISRVWHPCQGGTNNMTFPTAGLITRWGKIIDYLDKKGIQQAV